MTPGRLPGQPRHDVRTFHRNGTRFFPPPPIKDEACSQALAAGQAMDLYNNDSPAFTSWVIENDLLREPFVVIDVGV